MLNARVIRFGNKHVLAVSPSPQKLRGEKLDSELQGLHHLQDLLEQKVSPPTSSSPSPLKVRDEDEGSTPPGLTCQNDVRIAELRKVRQVEQKQIHESEDAHDELRQRYDDLQKEARHAAASQRTLEDQVRDHRRLSWQEAESYFQTETELRRMQRHCETLQESNQTLKSEIELQKNAEDSMFKNIRAGHEEESAKLLRETEALKSELCRAKSQANSPQSLNDMISPTLAGKPPNFAIDASWSYDDLKSELASRLEIQRKTFREEEERLRASFNTRFHAIVSFHKRVEDSLKRQVDKHKQADRDAPADVPAESGKGLQELRGKAEDCERINKYLANELKQNRIKLKLAWQGHFDSQIHTSPSCAGFHRSILTIAFTAWANSASVARFEGRMKMELRSTDRRHDIAQHIQMSQEKRDFTFLLFQCWANTVHLESVINGCSPQLDSLKSRHERLSRDHEVLAVETAELRECLSEQHPDTAYVMLREYLAQHLRELHSEIRDVPLSFTPSSRSSPALSRRGDNIRDERMLRLRDLQFQWSQFHLSNQLRGVDERPKTLAMGNKNCRAKHEFDCFTPVSSDGCWEELNQLRQKGESVRGKLKAKVSNYSNSSDDGLPTPTRDRVGFA